MRGAEAMRRRGRRVKLETGFLLNSDELRSAAPLPHEPQLAPPFEAGASAAVAATMQQLIDDLPEQIALLDELGNILIVNGAWRATVEEHGYFEAMPGHSYREFCAQKAAEGYEPAIEAVAALDDICSGRRSFWQMTYNGRERWKGRDYQICVHRIGVGAQTLISVTRYDLTEVVRLRRANSEGQAVERQRMARELHDSTSQLLAGAGLLLGRLKQEQAGGEALALVEELQQLVTEAQQEIRLVSYLAHPPALEKLGLVEALKSVTEGFGRRTALQTSFEIHGHPVSLPAEVESALYRVAQEGLSNVHRHARAKRVRLFLSFRRSAVHLGIADDGVGIPPESLTSSGRAGVGIASMRTRLSEVGGRLVVRRLSTGTAIIASAGFQP